MEITVPEIKLNDGMHIPVVGLGTVSLRGDEGATAISNAINSGYRLLDTAYNYENEGTIGEAIRRSTIAREKLLITSKLPGRYFEYEKALNTIQESLYRSNLDHYDFYFIHWPNPKRDQYVEAWQALITAKQRGLVRSIGVCNFLPEYIQRLEKETGVKPSVNQVELHPFFNQGEQRKWHEENEIATQSWSPLARGKDLLANVNLMLIAQRYQKTVYQVILRWHYQLGAISIPRSASPTHQLENIMIFDFALSETEMEQISAMTLPDGRLQGHDPAVFEVL